MNDEKLIELAAQQGLDHASIVISVIAHKLLWRRKEIEIKAKSLESQAAQAAIHRSSPYSFGSIGIDIDRLMSECRLLEETLKDMLSLEREKI